MVRDGKVRHFASSLAIALLFLLGAPRQSVAQIGQPAAAPPAASQNPLLGSVPTGQTSPTPVALSLKDALGRALQYNLGAIEADEDTRAAHAARLRNLSALLPNLSARVTSTVEEINLRTVGFFGEHPRYQHSLDRGTVWSRGCSFRLFPAALQIGLRSRV